MRRQNRKPKNLGFSLVEVLISLAIISVVSLAFAGLFSQMSREMRATNEKNDATEFVTKTATILSHLPVCDCQLSLNSTPFDSTASQPVSNISQILTSCEPTAELLMAADTAIPSARTKLSLDKIQITNIESLGSPDLFRGILKGTYKSGTLVRALKGFEYELRFETDPLSPATQKKLTKCLAISGMTALTSSTPVNFSGSCPAGEYLSGVSNGVIQCTPLPAQITSFTCPANEYLTGVVNGTPQCSSLKMKSCPPGQFMVGHNSDTLDCTRAPGATPTPGPWSVGNPGPGCSSSNCISEDFGPCLGNNCLTNGLQCKGAGCSACASGAVCTGANCCTGPGCPGCAAL